VQIYVNGAAHEVANGISMSDLIALLDLGGRRIALEVNRELVPRSTFSTRRLADQDRVEIVHAVGGG
jgi:sulfur carrier protein